MCIFCTLKLECPLFWLFHRPISLCNPAWKVQGKGAKIWQVIVCQPNFAHATQFSMSGVLDPLHWTLSKMFLGTNHCMPYTKGFNGDAQRTQTQTRCRWFHLSICSILHYQASRYEAECEASIWRWINDSSSINMKMYCFQVNNSNKTVSVETAETDKETYRFVREAYR